MAQGVSARGPVQTCASPGPPRARRHAPQRLGSSLAALPRRLPSFGPSEGLRPHRAGSIVRVLWNLARWGLPRLLGPLGGPRGGVGGRFPRAPRLGPNAARRGLPPNFLPPPARPTAPPALRPLGGRKAKLRPLPGPSWIALPGRRRPRPPPPREALPPPAPRPAWLSKSLRPTPRVIVGRSTWIPPHGLAEQRPSLTRLLRYHG